LEYELASVLASAGLYEEAADVLKQSFVLKEGKIETRLGGRRLAQAPGFLELLAPERRAGIFQPSAADSESNGGMLKALLVFSEALSQSGEKSNEADLVSAAMEFASGNDEMKSYRQIFAASRLLMKNVALKTVYDLAQSARDGTDKALSVGAVEVAVQADEFRDMRARVLASGGTPYVAAAPRIVLLNILLGRIEDLSGWALFNQDKTAEAIDHLKRAAAILPEATPAWRGALWHLGVALEQTGQKEEALDSYIKSYVAGDADPIRRQLIEQLYRKINGSLDGLDQRLEPSLASGLLATASPVALPETSPTPAIDVVATANSTPEPTPSKIEMLPEVLPTPTPEARSTPAAEKESASTATTENEKPPTAEPSPSPQATPEALPTPSPTEEQSMAQAAARIRANVTIKGRVRDANNTGIANVVVILISPRGTVLVSTTDEQGNYSFKVSPSQRNYRLVPSKEGYQFDPVDRGIVAFGEDLKDIDFVGTTRSP
jgi:tetratricopeptide (TPR) repeat protein